MDSVSMDVNVIGLSGELAQAVEVIMNPHTQQHARMEAYVACEKFKEVSPLCAQAGLYLANGPYTNPAVRHFGLQLMEHTVKFKWNCISQQEKIFIKENAMKLLFNSVGPVEDQSISHIKDALCRIIVEMIKREWPQQWTTLLAELSDACYKGEAQTELVLLIFLRLVEDVCLLQTIESNQRRKDIYQALTVNMTEIFSFFLRLIEFHVNAFRSATNNRDEQKSLRHSRVVQVVLFTLTGFVEWVSIVHIMAGEGRLLQILCILLNDDAFQIHAAECLSQIVNRKGQMKDRKPLVILFSEEAMRYLCQAINETNRLPVEHYMFIKKIVQVVSGLGSQITALWGKDENLIPPAQFSTFLQILFTLTSHPSLTVTHGSCLIWCSFLKHDQITKDSRFLEYIPKLIEVVGPKVIKVPYPTHRPIEITSSSEAFASMDYDSEDEFNVFFYRCRTDILEIFRQSTMIAPLLTFNYCEQWLNIRFQKAVAETNTTCSVQDPVYLEWEALVTVLEGVLSRILLVTERPSVLIGLRLLEQCLRIESKDPLIISIILTCISALFVFLSMSSCQITTGNCIAMTGVSLLPRILEKIFSAVVFVDPNNFEAVKALRRHSAALMVKIGIKYPLLLLPVFDQINSTCQNLFRQPHTLSKMEKITLQEALLVISNNFCDYERQSKFVSEIIQDSRNQWLNLSSILKSDCEFIKFIGLDRAAITPIDIDPTFENRRNLLHAVNTILSIIKRCSWPDDPDRASRGGFFIGYTESGNPIYRNPATTHVIPILPYLLDLLRIQNQLFSPELLNMIHIDYKNVYKILDTEKKNLMGVPAVLVDPLDFVQKKILTVEDKVQQYMTILFENCYHMMGAAGPSLGRDLYQLDGIADALINSVFSNLINVPDHRLRPIIRVFLKPFVYSCSPAFYNSVLLPIFSHLTPFMLTRLTTRWQYITELYESGELGGDADDTQEVFEDILNRTLTREYLDVLKVALVGGTDRDTTLTSNETMDFDDHSMDTVATMSVTRATQSAMASEVISELGAKLLRNQQTCTSIVFTIFNAVSWNDSLVSFKAVYLTGPIVRFLATEQLLTSTIASNIFYAVLQGLQVHGQHDSNQSTLITLGVQVYEILRPKFPHILEIIQQIPNINIADVQKLDEKISTCATKGNKIDKAKKDLFKKITAQLVGKNLGQLFRKEIKIVNLPPMNSSSRNASYTNLIDSTKDDCGISKIFSAKS